MDKLRAIEYFVVAVEEGSFARAARRLEVSVQAVQKLVGTLEQALGATLLERNTRGVRPTAAGSVYLDSCRPLLAELALAERTLTPSTQSPGGLLRVAANPQLVHHVLMPALPRFHALFPDIEIDLRTVHRMGDADADGADVLLLHGWPEAPPDHVHRKLGMAHSLIMAAPGYWAAQGVPRQPEDLRQHTCLLVRNPAGILIDLWEFTRGSERIQVQVRGWLSSNAREAVLDAVIGGHGVARFSEVTTREHVLAGRLVPALRDWEVQGGPPINLLYKGSARRTPRVRVFVDFALQCLRQLEAEGGVLAQRVSAERPAWHRRGYGRASAAVRMPR
ncbi:MAG: LysR substrate-binding domain-containing protein [Rhizobacter sp.]|nr:LysR substrate-binding domain-containing protein [Rhizobacter sp.]